MLTFSELARDKLAEFAANSEEENLALKISITGRSGNGFQYDLQLISPKEQEDSDHVFEVDDWTVIISESSVPYMEGVTLEFKETLMGGGFHFENPNPGSCRN
nr:iron-sulfur cluster assembly accessory protein [Euryarchaeota archaeon]